MKKVNEISIESVPDKILFICGRLFVFGLRHFFVFKWTMYQSLVRFHYTKVAFRPIITSMPQKYFTDPNDQLSYFRYFFEFLDIQLIWQDVLEYNEEQYDSIDVRSFSKFSSDWIFFCTKFRDE